jgi:hypothetical protein
MFTVELLEAKQWRQGAASACRRALDDKLGRIGLDRALPTEQGSDRVDGTALAWTRVQFG